MTEQQKGSIEECMSEATMEKYMNDNGLRFKMNKTAKEREGLKLFGGLLPEFEINVPFDQCGSQGRRAGSRVHLGGHRLHGDLQQRRARRREAEGRAEGSGALNQNTPTSSATGRRSALLLEVRAGLLVLLRSASTDPDEAGRGQIQTPANRQMSGSHAQGRLLLGRHEGHAQVALSPFV